MIKTVLLYAAFASLGLFFLGIVLIFVAGITNLAKGSGDQIPKKNTPVSALAVKGYRLSRWALVAMILFIIAGWFFRA